MRLHTGWVKEMCLEASEELSAWITCPEGAIPPPGCYLMATDRGAILGTPLFLEVRTEGGFIAAPPVPGTWEPGVRLELRGPLGHGFSLPRETRRLALAATGETPARLLPLVEQAVGEGMEVALFTDAPLPALHSALEASPLHALQEALTWADFLAFDLPLEKLPQLREQLGISAGVRLSCPGQALVFTALPCGGVAECGVCAVPFRRHWKLVCKDGPVFDLNDLLENFS